MKTLLALAVLALSVPAHAAPRLTKTFEEGAYRVSLEKQEGKLIAFVEARTKDGYAEVRDLTANGIVTGELILVGEGLTHVKSLMDPMEYEAGIVGPWLTFKLPGLKSGSYRAWVEVVRGGKTLLFPFNLGL